MILMSLSIRLIAAIAALLLTQGFCFSAQVRISGVARDSSGNKVVRPKITVRDAKGRLIASTEVQYDGDTHSYVVVVDTNSPNISVEFEDSHNHTPQITALSTNPKDAHVINPVLLLPSGPLSFHLIVSQIQIYEHIFLRDFGANPTRATLARLNKMYRGRIDQMPDPRRRYPPNATQTKALSDLTELELEILANKLLQLEGFYDGEILKPIDPLPKKSKPIFKDGLWWWWNEKTGRWMVHENGQWAYYQPPTNRRSRRGWSGSRGGGY